MSPRTRPRREAERIRKQDVRQFLERDPRVGRVIGVVEDPQVSGTFAARVTMPSQAEGPVDLLWVTGAGEYADLPLRDRLEALEEECDFTSWPPQSGALRFFL